jgi:hypothetical protein
MEHEEYIGRHEVKLEHLEKRVNHIDGKLDTILTLVTDIRIEMGKSNVKLAIYSGAVALFVSGIITAVINTIINK